MVREKLRGSEKEEMRNIEREKKICNVEKRK